MVTLNIRAANAIGIFASASDTTGPTAPVLSTTVLSSSSIQINLQQASTDPSGVARYELERSPNGTGSWTVLSANATFPFASSGLNPSTQYFYRARAVDTLNNGGPYSAIVNATTQAAADVTGPSAPTISAADTSSSTIQISLVSAATDPSGILRYEIDRSLTGTGSWVNITTDATFPYSATGLSASTQYFFRCRAVDNIGNLGTYSAVVNDTTPSAPVSSAGFSANSGYVVTALDSGFANGQRIRIDRAAGGFGTKPGGQLPLIVFEHQTSRNPSSTYSRDTGVITQYESHNIHVASGAPLLPNSTGMLRSTMSGAFPHIALNGPGLFFSGTKMMRVTKRYYGWNWKTGPQTNIKAARFHTSVNQGTLLIGYSQPNEGFTPAIQREWPDRTDNYFDVNFVPEVLTWLNDEHFYQASSLDVSNGVLRLYSNARAVINGSFFMTRRTAYQGLFDDFYLDQISNNAEPEPSYAYIDFDYQDDSWCSVFHTSETTYLSNQTSAQHTREYCIPYLWSDTRIEAYLRYGAQTSIVNRRLMIRDNSHNILIPGAFVEA